MGIVGTGKDCPGRPQDGEPLAPYTRGLSNAQREWTIQGRDLLGIIGGLEAYGPMLRGQGLGVYAGHLALLCRPRGAPPRVARWRCLLEE